MTVHIEASWKEQLQGEFDQPYWADLAAFVRAEYAAGRCFPQGKNIFRAFDLTPFNEVKVVILGQDPYHTPGAAMGFCFSIPDGNRPQPSLQNIFKEIESDLGVVRRQTDLSDWAAQGVFLLNSVLTVKAHEAGSHAGKGWERFTDSAIKRLSDERENLVFILWGSYAIAKKALIDTSKHLAITSPHPSPLSA
ncbi:MAG TPA: uracil-DNA glycosylase, partial [Janthinobacterium sp.]|nr:uracil-DNA glycosylase [Janthinobacterium sp.]